MESKILITYASRTGSTAGVAETIGRTLAERGVAVDVRAMSEVRTIYGYDAVVIGSAVQSGALLPEALEFVSKNREALRGKPCAVFLVCMTLAMTCGDQYHRGDQYRQHVSGWLEPVRSAIRPASEGLFAGALDIRKIKSPIGRLKFRLSVMAGVWQEGDHRDWEAVRAWAEYLPTRLYG